jgi:hypothetical protein
VLRSRSKSSASKHSRVSSSIRVIRLAPSYATGAGHPDHPVARSHVTGEADERLSVMVVLPLGTSPPLIHLRSVSRRSTCFLTCFTCFLNPAGCCRASQGGPRAARGSEERGRAAQKGVPGEGQVRDPISNKYPRFQASG